MRATLPVRSVAPAFGWLLAFVIGCGGGSPDVATSDINLTESGDASAAPMTTRDRGHVSSTFPAFVPSVPQLVGQGGPVIVSPEITPISFDADDASARQAIESFVQQVGSTDYWSAVTAEYGIGRARGMAPVHVAEPPPASVSDDDVRAWLTNRISSAHIATNANSIFAIFYPSASHVTFKGIEGCKGFGGYHESMSLSGGERVSYVVVPRCATFNQLTGMNMVTALASHELAESATDPEPSGHRGFVELDRDHFVWQVFDGDENGDLCTSSSGATFTPSTMPFVVQRTWSNAAARRGKSPCQPQGEVYFNSAVVMPDRISMHALGGGPVVETAGIRAALHETKVVEIDLFSDGPTRGPWQVSAIDITGSLSLTLDRTSGQNGEKLYLTIGVNRIDSNLGATPFQIVSTLGQTEQRWYGLVGE